MESRERSAAIRQVVAPHLSRAYNLARLLVGNQATRKTWSRRPSFRAFRALGGFHGGDAKSWLLVIVRNVCYSFLGRNRGNENVVEFEEEQHCETAASATPESFGAANCRLQRHYERAIDELPAEFREALVLRELEELSYPPDRGDYRRSGRHGDVATCTRASTTAAAVAAGLEEGHDHAM